MSHTARPLFFSALAAALFVLPAHGNEEKSSTQWAGELGSENPAIRQTAAEDLIALGGGSEAILLELAKHPDPWIAARATRLLMEIRGIDTRIPLRLQHAVMEFENRDELRRTELIAELTKAGPGHLNALAFLYNRTTTKRPPTENDARLWFQRFQSCIAANLQDTGTLKPESLSPATRALMLACLPDRLTAENTERYAKWRILDEAIRFHLTANRVALEISYLQRQAGPADMLEYLPRIICAEAQIHATGLIRDIILKDKDFKADLLSESASIGHLITLLSSSSFQLALPWYEKHLARHSGLAAALPPDLLILEAARLKKSGKTTDSIRLALRPPTANHELRTIDWNFLREIGLSLGTKPEALPEGLPAIPDAQSLPAMGRLLSEWFPMTRPGAGYRDIDAKAECFDRWAKTAEWLEAARRFGPQPLYHLVMARRGKLGAALLVHEFEHEDPALRHLGTLILMRPAIGRDLPARTCSANTLRHILDGGLDGFGLGSPPPWPIVDLAATWEDIHPDLLAPDSFPTQPLYQAIRVWKTGGHQDAAAALLRCLKPIPQDAPSLQSRVNPLAATATCLLAELLAETPAADAHLLLPADQVSRETLVLIFDRLNREENRTLNQVRRAMDIAALLKERFDLNDAKPLLSSHDARAMACDAWMAGDDPLAGDFLITAFLTDPDPEEHYDAAFASALALLGRSEEILGKLDAAKPTMQGEIYQSKRARLLRSLGHASEAMKTISPGQQPALRLSLAIETGDWQAAILSAHKMEPDSSAKREGMNACIAVLSGKPELINRHTAREHPVIALLQGNALREADLADMARDAELAARREARLTAALASGAPVPVMLMGEYFRFLDLLPDKPRGIRLARDLAKRELCEINGETNIEGGKTAHKVIAAEALLLLGRGDLAFDAMRPVMATSAAPHDFRGVAHGASGGFVQPIVAGYRQVTRIADWEWPRDAPEKRIDHLAAILGHADPRVRARSLITLVSKHAGNLQKLDLLQALWLPFCDLAQAGEVPEDLRENARTMLEKLQPDERERRWLQSQSQRIPWQMESSHPPSKGKTTTQITFTPEPGVKADPKQAAFVTIDGIVSAAKLQHQGNTAAARILIRDVILRLLLDPVTASQEVKWTLDARSAVLTSGRKFTTRGLETLLQSFAALELPADPSPGFIDACATPWTNHADQQRLLLAASILAKSGNHQAALSYHQRFLVMTIPAIGSSKTGAAGRKEIAEMQCFRGLLSATRDEHAGSVDSVRRLVQLAPYQPELASGIAAILKQKGQTETLKAARSAIDGFWATRLLEIPASETYQHWKTQWETLFP